MSKPSILPFCTYLKETKYKRTISMGTLNLPRTTQKHQNQTRIHMETSKPNILPNIPGPESKSGNIKDGSPDRQKYFIIPHRKARIISREETRLQTGSSLFPRDCARGTKTDARVMPSGGMARKRLGVGIYWCDCWRYLIISCGC